MTTAKNLGPVAKVLGRIKMPPQAREIRKRLGLGQRQFWMITNAPQLYDAALVHNWRMLPVQFGLPAASHSLAELIRAAGFEAIKYRSTKGQGHCVALFPDQLATGSYVALADPGPSRVKHVRLGGDSCDDLAGWDSLPPDRRPRWIPRSTRRPRQGGARGFSTQNLWRMR